MKKIEVSYKSFSEEDWVSFIERGALDAEALDQIADCKNTQIQLAVIKRPEIWPSTLIRIFMTTEVGYLRAKIAKIPNGPREIRELAAKDPDMSVRKIAAGDVYTPGYILRILASDIEQSVSQEAFKNPSTPTDVLEKKYHSGRENHFDILGNSSAPKTVVSEASRDDEEHKIAAARHQNIPLKDLKRLALDPCEAVRVTAVQNPKYQKVCQKKNK